MAAGLPVVAGDLPVFREYLLDHHDALLPRSGDSAALAASMMEMYADTALRRRLVAGGLGTAGRYRWSASAQRHAAIYDEVRATRAPAVRRG